MNPKKIIFLFSLFILGSFLCTSCDKENGKIDNPVNPLWTVPIVSTLDASQVNNYSAKIGGTVSSDGGSTLIERGVCFNYSSNPNINDDTRIKLANILGTIEFTFIVGDTSNTVYYKAYGINSVGVGYGEQKSFKTLK